MGLWLTRLLSYSGDAIGMAYRHLTWVMLLGSVSGCGHEQIDLIGRKCPCADDSRCDPVCQVCVPPESAPGALCSTSNLPDERQAVDPVDASACVAKVTFTDFMAAWVTPNSIRWTWQPNDAPESWSPSFQSYRLELTSGAKVLTFDVSTNPELGLAVLPNGGSDPTNSAITDGLEPGTTYTGTLIARDTSGCEFSRSNIAPATSFSVSSAPLELFGESPFNGGTMDGSVVNTGCHHGVTCLMTNDCVVEPGSSTCTKNLRAYNIDVGPGALSIGGFAQAYLEFYARTDTPAPSYYSMIFLEVGSDVYRFEGFTFPRSEQYRRVQIPLRALASGPRALDFAALQTGHILQFNFGTHLAEGAHTWVDEVYVRW